MAGGITAIGGSLGGARQLTGAQPSARELGALGTRAVSIGLWLFVPPSADLGTEEEVMLIGSDYPMGAGETIYLAPWIDGRPMKGCPLPPGTLRSMRFYAEDEDGPVAPGVGQTFTYTVTKNGDDTGCVIVLTGAQTQGKSSVPVTFADGDKLNVRVVASAGAGGSRKPNHNGSLRYAPDPDED